MGGGHVSLLRALRPQGTRCDPPHFSAYEYILVQRAAPFSPHAKNNEGAAVAAASRATQTAATIGTILWWLVRLRAVEEAEVALTGGGSACRPAAPCLPFLAPPLWGGDRLAALRIVCALSRRSQEVCASAAPQRRGYPHGAGTAT